MLNELGKILIGCIKIIQKMQYIELLDTYIQTLTRGPAEARLGATYTLYLICLGEINFLEGGVLSYGYRPQGPRDEEIIRDYSSSVLKAISTTPCGSNCPTTCLYDVTRF
jgi:hypothetical protein